MRNYLIASQMALVICVAGSTLVAAQSPQREEAVQACVAQAQKEIPNVSGDPSDPQYNSRYVIYATCMQARNQRP